jgi:hypothetical protein
MDDSILAIKPGPGIEVNPQEAIFEFEGVTQVTALHENPSTQGFDSPLS